jgi:hypothetical protein
MQYDDLVKLCKERVTLERVCVVKTHNEFGINFMEAKSKFMIINSNSKTFIHSSFAAPLTTANTASCRDHRWIHNSRSLAMRTLRFSRRAAGGRSSPLLEMPEDNTKDQQRQSDGAVHTS